MIVSVNWIKKYTKITLNDDEIVNRIGERIGEVDSVTKLADKYKGIKVAEIIEAKDHPEADKLGVYIIDSGEKNIQVVAGDRTLKVGDRVAYIAPGLIVPSTYYDEEPFKLTKIKLRGLNSHGMLGSAKELDFGDEHKGVLKLDTKAKLGTDLIDAYELDDVIVELDNKSFTNRPDCFGIIGFAREVAGVQNMQFKTPEWLLKSESVKASDVGVSVKNQIEDEVPTYLLQKIEGIQNKESPIMVQTYLNRVGVRPISAVVDATNYMMALTGQPLHAFDADKVTGTISVRHAKKGEKLVLLDDSEVEFQGKEVLICDANGPIAIGGVMGGKATEVSNKTKNILLESANFNMHSIRRSSMQHGIFSDAVMRFSRGQSPQLSGYVLPEASKMIIDMTGGRVASKLTGNSAKFKPEKVSASVNKMGSILGKEIEPSKASNVLSSIGLENTIKEDVLKVVVPYWRNDIHIEEDIAEELGRLSGYDNITPTLPRSPTKAYPAGKLHNLKSRIKKTLIAGGANEALTYSGVSSKTSRQIGWDESGMFHISNSRSPDLEFMRPALISSLIEKVHANHKRGHTEFGLFEMNPAHRKEATQNNLPIESNRLGFVFSSQAKPVGAPYYSAKLYLSLVLASLNMQNVRYEPVKATSLDIFTTSAFNHDRSAAVYFGKKCVGIVGEFSASVTKGFKLRENCAGFELLIDELEILEDDYAQLNKYPAVTRDVTYEIKDKTTLYDLKTEIETHLRRANIGYELDASDIFRGKGKRRITFTLKLWNPAKTLTSKEVNNSVEALAEHLNTTISATQI